MTFEFGLPFGGLSKYEDRRNGGYSSDTGVRSSLRRGRDVQDYGGDSHSADEADFDDGARQKLMPATSKNHPKAVVSGRQRVKSAARSKGSDFLSQRRKRRVYFACVSSEIDIQDLFDYLTGSGSSFSGWSYAIFGEVLWIYNSGRSESASGVPGPVVLTRDSSNLSSADNPYNLSTHSSQEIFVFNFGAAVLWCVCCCILKCACDDI